MQKYNGSFASAQDGYDYFGPVSFDLSFGLATFVNSQIKINHLEEKFVYRHKNALINNDNATMGVNIQTINLGQDKSMNIMNFHGLWNRLGKIDCPERIEQSNNLKNIMNKLPSPIILCGDFNLSPDTKSLAILEEGMVNLVKKYGINSTRTSFYEKENRFADYMLALPEITVKDFEVLPDEVSDHSPLYLEFEI